MKSSTSILFLVFSLAVYSCVALPYSKDSGVIALTKNNFAQLVFSSEHVWLVEFYAPWCGHCRNLAPEWEKAAKNLKGIVKVAAVNCDEEKELAGAFGVQGFPTIKLFPSKMTPTPDGKGVHKVPIDYQGARTAAAIANFAVGHLPSFVTVLKNSALEDFLSSDADLAKVILFTDKTSTTNLYKALSVDFHYALKFGEVRKSETEIIKKYDISKFPSLIVVTAGGEVVPYEGQLKHEALFTFLSKYAKKLEKQTGGSSESSSSSSSSSSSTPPPPPEPQHDVREEVTDQAVFEKLCSVNCFITVFDSANTEPETHEKYLKELETINEKWKKYFNFIWIDAAKQTDFVETFNLYSGFPTSMILNLKKSSQISYFGSLVEENVSEFLDSILAGRRASKFDRVPKLASKAKDEL